MVAENDVKNKYGQFMHFKTLTWVPIDMDAIDLSCMREVQKNMLREVYS